VASFVLVHSPLVGPTTWKWVADELRTSGHEVVVPCIDPTSTAKGWRAVVDSVFSQVGRCDGTVFVAHSGAGPLMTSIVGDSGSADPMIVLVDAGIASETSETRLMPEEFLGELTAMAVDGVLPPWSEWLGPDVMEELIPDSARRASIEGELPSVPLSYFSGVVPPARPWPATRNGYVLLSDAYLGDAEEARRRRWPVVEVRGTHLGLVTDPTGVAEAITAVVESSLEP
jgi:hypothetical protein